MKKSALILCIIFVSVGVHAKKNKETIDLKGMSIKGDAEEPQVLYIVPWREAKEDELFSNAEGAEENKIYLDREVLLRQLEIKNQLSSTTKGH